MKRALLLCLLLSGCVMPPQPPPMVSCERKACPSGFHCFRCTKLRMKEFWEADDNPWDSTPDQRVEIKTMDIKLELAPPLVVPLPKKQADARGAP